MSSAPPKMLALAASIADIAAANDVALYGLELVFEYDVIYILPDDKGQAQALSDALLLTTSKNRGTQPFWIHTGETDGMRITMFGAAVDDVEVAS